MHPSPQRVASRFASGLQFDRFYAALHEMRRRIPAASDFRMLDLEIANVQQYVTGGARAGYLPKSFPRTYNKMLRGVGIQALGDDGLGATKQTYLDIIDAMEKAAQRTQKRQKLGKGPGEKVTYDVEDPDSKQPGVNAFVGDQEVGFVSLLLLDDPGRQVKRHCLDDWERVDQDLRAQGARGVYTYRVTETDLYRDEYLGMGIGKGMYEALLKSLPDPGEPIILVADDCGGGSTSRAALRVWASLSKRWLSSGLVVASAPR